MAARSFFITIQNFTGRVWQRSGLGLAHGIWSNNDALIPPEQLQRITLDNDGNAIPGVVQFCSESDGFATGTEGFVEYQSDVGILHVGWDNPFVGSNGFGVNVPDGFTNTFGDISGNDANVTVILRKA